MNSEAPQHLPSPRVVLAAALIAGGLALGLSTAVPAGAAPKSIDQQKSECEAKGGTWVGGTDGTSFCTAPVGGTIFECDVRGNCSDDPMPLNGGDTRPVLPGANAPDQPASTAPGPKAPPVFPRTPGSLG